MLTNTNTLVFVTPFLFRFTTLVACESIYAIYTELYNTLYRICMTMMYYSCYNYYCYCNCCYNGKILIAKLADIIEILKKGKINFKLAICLYVIEHLIAFCVLFSLNGEKFVITSLPSNGL